MTRDERRRKLTEAELRVMQVTPTAHTRPGIGPGSNRSGRSWSNCLMMSGPCNQVFASCKERNGFGSGIGA